jgi:hypothetical protein
MVCNLFQYLSAKPQNRLQRSSRLTPHFYCWPLIWFVFFSLNLLLNTIYFSHYTKRFILLLFTYMVNFIGKASASCKNSEIPFGHFHALNIKFQAFFKGTYESEITGAFLVMDSVLSSRQAFKLFHTFFFNFHLSRFSHGISFCNVQLISSQVHEVGGNNNNNYLLAVICIAFRKL